MTDQADRLIHPADREDTERSRIGQIGGCGGGDVKRHSGGEVWLS